MSGPVALSDIPVTQLNGVAARLAERLATLHIHTVQDLLFHLPLRYQDRTQIASIGRVRLGDDVMLEAEILSCDIDFGRRRSLVCRIKDAGGIISLRFFHFSAAQKKMLAPGNVLRCYGEIRSGKNGYELYHPEYQVLKPGEIAPVADRLTPIYPATEGLQQTRLRKLIDQALALLQSPESLPDWIPASVLNRVAFPGLADALQYLHHPPVQAPVTQLLNGEHPAQQRLAFEELLSHRLCLRRLRQQSAQHHAPLMAAHSDLGQAFRQQLPFALTRAQTRVSNEISHDLGLEQPMLRLLQGDVGSGKTVVAALAALQAVDSGYQAVIMAPTEILAEQHHVNFTQWLAPLGLQPGWLSGKVKGRQRQQTLQGLRDGSSKIAVGTHALFQEGVEFSNLGLIIIDEQHRFGVHQRLALREKGNTGMTIPHQLVMTATPIPRTLAMSAYADLDCSVLDELPPGRTPVNTVIISNERRDEVIARIHQACLQGNQAYWVCTLIDESEALQAQAAEATLAALQTQLPDLAIGLVHGRMKATEKSAVMAAFKKGELHLLIATTVIEVGVDVPNASLMIIENPERLGLAQLHQLRGRVGRGAKASHCLLLYQTPLSQLGKQRLGIMRDSNDGFYIAEQDLAIRGPGQVLGTRQTGLMSFRIADLARDAALLDPVKSAADTIEHDYPSHIDPLVNRWLGDRELYGNV
ncbi:ATP-dependent DNA helicase RecG [Pseudohongiella sp.]|uniref:ATP-dependent DNA helicase RecG n=1 Tax=marine sediment metagenome TaxID=412755 RepID=A0A0F9W9E0_9ZZZZ|nr:ATP-dependent DNA helicase RecG [Pseudohongiella sp.]HDZ08622.1 ATP-dependent DNA helicase RecG [Pseudohongiella sp.]HEA64200.1 ATP-dependent DNA helicase RecG [Pseudohongiella sp.]